MYLGFGLHGGGVICFLGVQLAAISPFAIATFPITAAISFSRAAIRSILTTAISLSAVTASSALRTANMLRLTADKRTILLIFPLFLRKVMRLFSLVRIPFQKTTSFDRQL